MSRYLTAQYRVNAEFRSAQSPEDLEEIIRAALANHSFDLEVVVFKPLGYF